VLNWRRDPDDERHTIQDVQRKMLHEQRIRQHESDILRVRNETERL
jgi:hypothetical protein